MPLCLCLAHSAPAQEEAHLSVSVDSASNVLMVAVPPALHAKFGCAYPLTYQLQIPDSSSGLAVQRRHSSLEAWETLPERSSTDHFNGIEAVRFDYPGGRAHVSAAFAEGTDSLLLQVVDSTGAALSPFYQGIDRYYDDRQAAVTVSADDWDDSTDPWEGAALRVFRAYGLYVTAGVITGANRCSARTWADVQAQVDSGFVEVASHSRSHVNCPYADPAGEVLGSASDIMSHVRLSPPFASAEQQHVYVWIAPYGSYDGSVDSLLGVGGYLIPRLYNHVGQCTLSPWERGRDHFLPIQPTVEIGRPPWGGGSADSSWMNACFDAAVAAGGVYQLMWHPQVVWTDLNLPYFTSHLVHISGRTDLWYANLGCVYLYELIQQANTSGATAVRGSEGETALFALRPNHPNPCRGRTSIRYQVKRQAVVSVRVFDVQGRRVATLEQALRSPGSYELTWDVRNVTSGLYFCRLDASMPGQRGGTFSATRKMLVVK